MTSWMAMMKRLAALWTVALLSTLYAVLAKLWGRCRIKLVFIFPMLPFPICPRFIFVGLLVLLPLICSPSLHP